MKISIIDALKIYYGIDRIPLNPDWHKKGIAEIKRRINRLKGVK